MSNSKKLFPKHLRDVEKIKNSVENIENLLNALNFAEKENLKLRNLFSKMMIEKFDLNDNDMLVIQVENLYEQEESLIGEMIKDVLPKDIPILLSDEKSNISMLNEEQLEKLGYKKVKNNE